LGQIHLDGTAERREVEPAVFIVAPNPGHTVVDYFTRKCLGLVADTSLTAPRLVRELNHIIESRVCPRIIVSDNGSEFTDTVSAP